MAEPIPIRRRNGPVGSPPTTDDLLRQVLAERDAALAVVAGCDALIEELRRRWRAERPGTYLLPSIEQLRREFGFGA